MLPCSIFARRVVDNTIHATRPAVLHFRPWGRAAVDKAVDTCTLKKDIHETYTAHDGIHRDLLGTAHGPRSAQRERQSTKHGPRPAIYGQNVTGNGARPTAGHVMGNKKAGTLAGLLAGIGAVIRPDLTGKGGRCADSLAPADGHLCPQCAD